MLRVSNRMESAELRIYKMFKIEIIKFLTEKKQFFQ
jgi:hypothetical protein